MIEAFASETNYTVWTEIASNLGTLGNLLSNTVSKDLYREFIKKLFTQVYEHVTWNPVEGESKFTHMFCCNIQHTNRVILNPSF